MRDASDHKTENTKESKNRVEKRTSPEKYYPPEAAKVKRRDHPESTKKTGSLNELGLKKNLSKSETRQFHKEMTAELNRTDPHWREADRRTKEGMREFKNNPKARRDFSHAAGTEEHNRWESEKTLAEQKAGRVKGRDFQTESVHRHPDGRPVRLDFEDKRNDIIIDRKPIGKNETPEQLKKKYEKQRTRHIEAYEKSTGRKPTEYQYSLYPSPKDI